MNRRHLLAILLAAIAAATWWWLETEREEGPPPKTQTRRPDYIVDHFTATQMDVAGQVHRQLEARELRHFPDDDSSELERPTLTVFPDEGPPWIASALAGWLSGDGSLLRLHGDVVIRRAGGANNRPVRIETDALRVRPESEYAETDLPVRVESEANSLRSTGLRAWLGEALRIELPGRSHALLHLDR